MGVVSLALVVMWVEAAVEAPSAQAAPDLREFAATGVRMDVSKEFSTAPSDGGQYVPQATIRPISFRPINLDESDTAAPVPPASAPAPVPEISPPPVAPPIVSPQRAESTPGPPMMEDISVTADEPRYVRLLDPARTPAEPLIAALLPDPSPDRGVYRKEARSDQLKPAELLRV